MMMTRKFHTFRRITGAALLIILIGTPFLRIGGESAFRFDVPSLRLLFFGTEIWMTDFFIVLIAVLFLTFITLFTTTLFGRIWCGWLCPQTVLSDATAFVETAQNRGAGAKIVSSIAGIVISTAVSASLIGYFVSPYDLSPLLGSGGMPARVAVGSWIVLSLILFLDIIALRRRFCATVCPYAKMQGVLFDDRTLLVAFDPSRAGECMECGACVKACPVGIDIRKGSQPACIHCAECIDACTARMAARKRKSLVRYAFGLTGEKGGGLRLTPLITGVLTVVSFVFLVYLSTTRVPFDMNVRRDYRDAPVIAANGGVTNTYELSLRNTGRSDLELGLVAAAPAGVVRVTPEAVILPRGTDVLRLPVSVTLTGYPGPKGHSMTVTLTARLRDGNSLSKKAFFPLPGHE